MADVEGDDDQLQLAGVETERHIMINLNIGLTLLGDVKY